MKTEMNCLRRKLASRRGASITFALLLFLICAVIGVIVLVAGTAAAGRTSRLVEADQRYFAVNSAAQLLREEIEGSSVTVSRTRTVTGRYGKYVFVWEEERENPDTHEMEVRQISRDPTDFVDLHYLYTLTPPEPDSSLPILQDAACYYVFGNKAAAIAELDSSGKQSLWERKVSCSRESKVWLVPKNDPEKIRLQVIGEGETAPKPVNLSVTLEKNGDLQVTVWQEDEDKNETYTVTMVFSASHNELYNNTKTIFPTADDLGPPDGATVIELTTVDDIGSQVDTFTWTLAELKKGGEAEE